MEGYETGYTKNGVGWCGLASFCSEWGLVMGSSKHFNELFWFHKRGEYLE